MKENFKLFDLLNGNQLLVTRDYNGEDENPCVTISFFADGVKVEMGLNYESESTRDKIFDDFAQNDAEVMHENICKNICKDFFKYT